MPDVMAPATVAEERDEGLCDYARQPRARVISSSPPEGERLAAGQAKQYGSKEQWKVHLRRCHYAAR